MGLSHDNIVFLMAKCLLRSWVFWGILREFQNLNEEPNIIIINIFFLVNCELSCIRVLANIFKCNIYS